MLVIVSADCLLNAFRQSMTAMHMFVRTMLGYPEIQRAGQDELDRVVGPDSLPGFGDQRNRWRRVAVVLARTPQRDIHATRHSNLTSSRSTVRHGSSITPRTSLYHSEARAGEPRRDMPHWMKELPFGDRARKIVREHAPTGNVSAGNTRPSISTSRA